MDNGALYRDVLERAHAVADKLHESTTQNNPRQQTMSRPVCVIAEAGVNHNGDIDLAFELVDAAVGAGADVIKFQSFCAAKLVSATAPKAAYQIERTGAQENQRDMLERLELSTEQQRALWQRCRDRDIEFLSTPFDDDSLKFLVADLVLGTIKIGSGDLTNAPLLLEVARSGVQVILSTGMGTLAEVEEALGVLAFGYLGTGEPVRRSDFAHALHAPQAWDLLRERVTLLHCTSEYPAPVASSNLRVMATLSAAFGMRVGYSDHTDGMAVSLGAVALGAEVIEKHLTIDRTLPGPDHAASMTPPEFAELVSGIRAVSASLGTGVKQPSAEEVANRGIGRKSLHVARDLEAGHELAAADLRVMRPGSGRSPMHWWDSVGTRLPEAVRACEPLSA